MINLIDLVDEYNKFKFNLFGEDYNSAQLDFTNVYHSISTLNDYYSSFQKSLESCNNEESDFNLNLLLKQLIIVIDNLEKTLNLITSFNLNDPYNFYDTDDYSISLLNYTNYLNALIKNLKDFYIDYSFN